MQNIYVFILVRINGHCIYPCMIENQTSLSCYCPFFTLNLDYTEAEYYLLFVLEGRLFLVDCSCNIWF